ncbi:hypothetical protein [Thiomicrorhabdus sp. Kp2]|uniref:hypothetical protein n=1 Tax=Thiomicrorhabdus sp. Kp2 TaxID=1123518 RepID=UPI0003FC8397|nr:hypothetical protein [Thiomicrorhabdus sp. Kp2]
MRNQIPAIQKIFNKSHIQMTKSKSLVVMALSVSALNLTGCSTIADGMDAVGSGVVYVAEGFDKVASEVAIEKKADDQFVLTENFYEPVRSLDSWSMRIEARDVCPQGYIYLNRFAQKTSGFAYSDAQCEADMPCEYKLEWLIKCQDVPKEPFSLFGKT